MLPHRYQPAYGRQQRVAVDRQCVFAAATGETHYLWDEAAGRAVWPVRCGLIDLAGVARDRAQLWAEAKRLYDEGVSWQPQPALSAIYRREAEARLIADPWAERIRDYARMHPVFNVTQLLEQYQVPFHLQSKAIEARIVRILTRAGFVLESADDGSAQWRNPAAPKGATGGAQVLM
jgi:predicted P-loop ATPase